MKTVNLFGEEVDLLQEQSIIKIIEECFKQSQDNRNSRRHLANCVWKFNPKANYQTIKRTARKIQEEGLYPADEEVRKQRVRLNKLYHKK